MKFALFPNYYPMNSKDTTPFAEITLHKQNMRKFTFTKLLLAAFAFIFISGTANATKRFVDEHNVSGNYTGTSWATAFKRLQPALAAAVAGDTIFVARGTYYTDTLLTDQTKTFSIPSGVVMWGGYPTGGGTRNPEVNISMLSGDLNLDASSSPGDAYHIVTFNGSKTIHPG